MFGIRSRGKNSDLYEVSITNLYGHTSSHQGSLSGDHQGYHEEAAQRLSAMRHLLRYNIFTTPYQKA